MGGTLTALDRTLFLNGYSMLLCAYADDAPEREKIKLLSGNTDGIVVLPSKIGAEELTLLCEGMPVVALDCVFPGTAIDSVLTDYLGAAYQAVRITSYNVCYTKLLRGRGRHPARADCGHRHRRAGLVGHRDGCAGKCSRAGSDLARYPRGIHLRLV